MPDPDRSVGLELYLPREVRCGMYPHKLELSEGLSRISTAVLTFYTQEALTMADLRRMTGLPATVRMSQSQGEDGKTFSRWFSGIVTSVEHKGVVSSREQEIPVLECTLTIRSPLVESCYAVHRLSYQGKTARHVLEDVISTRYGIDLEFADDVGSDKAVCVDEDDLYQGDESDYDFVRRIMLKYGLSYVFRSGKPEGDAPGAPTMVVMGGVTDTPCSETEGAELPEVLACSCDETGDGTFRLSGWRMRSDVGVDYVGIDHQGAKPVVASAGDGSGRRGMIFNHSPLGRVTEANADMVAGNYLGSARAECDRWTGDAFHLAVMTGRGIDVGGFYGRDGGTVEARVVAADTTVRTPWPSTLLGSREDGEAVADLRIGLQCMERDRRFATPMTERLMRTDVAASAATGSAIVPDGSPSGANASGSVPTSNASPAVTLVQAVVCDASGRTTSDNAAQALDDDGTVFRALPHGATAHVKARLLMPLGGKGEGLFYAPRLGDNVLLGMFDEEYYLLGYLPTSERRFSKVATADMTSLRHNVAGSVANLSDVPVVRTTSEANRFSELGMYTNAGKTPFVNLGSQGDLQMSANADVNVNGRNLTFSTPGWTQDDADWKWGDGSKGEPSTDGVVAFSGINKLTVTAVQEIKFQVGLSSITVNRSGVTVVSGMATTVPGGPLVSRIIVNPLSGVVINGANIVMGAVYSAAMSDGFGGTAAVSSGTVAMTGNKVAQILLAPAMYRYKVGLLTEKIVGQIAGGVARQVQESGKAEGYVQLAQTAGIGIIDDAAKVRIGWKDDENKALSFVMLVLNLFDNIVMFVEGFMGQYEPDNVWWDKPVAGVGGKALTNRDAFRLVSMAAKFAVVTGLTLYAGGILKLKPKSKASVVVDPEGVVIHGKDDQSITVTETKMQTPVNIITSQFGENDETNNYSHDSFVIDDP